MDISSVLQGAYHHPLAREWQSRRSLTKSMLMYPIFVTDDPQAEVPIAALPGQKRWGVDRLHDFLGPLVQKGLKSDDRGTPADDPAGPVILAIRKLRQLYPDLYIAADVCLCEYTSHGHCGYLVPGTRIIDQAPSAARIADVALAYASAGAHCVAPSDMMDGRIAAIKRKLIDAGLANQCTLMSYSAKFASGLYGPFREAAGSVPNFGDRKCYQLPPNARGLAQRAITRDINEGADIIMVKPALPYLDILADAQRLAPSHPLAAYQASPTDSLQSVSPAPRSAANTPCS
ncbi:Delta-aminolevulinic acid dehydratase [Ceratobasidium theobromae]|uniref:Delta-aminolevulinic acid dehydratase n=1 Tax=Ceratobasidium theobromae TaxID=1582974 RepID=A0A5N5Q977_9AGAM|nr:Delta-aminolevulinic acid dehydratase [Ceratobasidium theobromae]